MKGKTETKNDLRVCDVTSCTTYTNCKHCKIEVVRCQFLALPSSSSSFPRPPPPHNAEENFYLAPPKEPITMSSDKNVGKLCKEFGANETCRFLLRVALTSDTERTRRDGKKAAAIPPPPTNRNTNFVSVASILWRVVQYKSGRRFNTSLEPTTSVVLGAWTGDLPQHELTTSVSRANHHRNSQNPERNSQPGLMCLIVPGKFQVPNTKFQPLTLQRRSSFLNAIFTSAPK